MVKPIHTLALEMSMDGIALHQFTFDGHWHEMSRIGLTDAALQAKMANMRQKAAQTQGRKCRTVIWLPDEQLIRRTLPLNGTSEETRKAEAKKNLIQELSASGSDLAVLVGEQTSDGLWPVVAARKSVMREARDFAYAHRFMAVAYSTRHPIEGFSEQPVFTLPVSKKRIGSFAMVAALVAALVVAGGFGVRMLNPFDIWDDSPRLEDLAPYRGAGLAPDNSADNILPIGLGTPVFPGFAALEAQAAHEANVDLPPFQTMAAVQMVAITRADPLTNAFDVTIPAALIDPAPDLPEPVGRLGTASAVDLTPNLGPFSTMTEITALPMLEPGAQPRHLYAPNFMFIPEPKPATFAGIRFFLEPLPPVATRMSDSTLAGLTAELASIFGVRVTGLGTDQAVTRLLETEIVEVTPGLPPQLPVLRSGRTISPQVPRPVAPAPEVNTPVIPSLPYRIVQGAPDQRPPLRPVVPEPVAPQPDDGLNIIEGSPGFTPRRRPEVAQAETVEEVVATDPPLETVEVVEAPEPVDPTETANIIAAILDETPEPVEEIIAVAVVAESFPGVIYGLQEGGEYRIVAGQPQRLPLMRSGQDVPEAAPVTATGAPVDAATLQANALRALRRPKSIAEMPAPIDPMMSDAAPATAFRPATRTEAFEVNAARIAEIAVARPRTVAPPVPADPPPVNLPSSASVQREATDENAINLRKTNLIGILGTPDSRTVMIRLASGRIISGLHLGESFSGWQIIAIGDDSITIKRGRREEILRLP